MRSATTDESASEPARLVETEIPVDPRDEAKLHQIVRGVLRELPGDRPVQAKYSSLKTWNELMRRHPGDQPPTSVNAQAIRSRSTGTSASPRSASR